MGRYVRHHQAPTVEERRLRNELSDIQNRVRALEGEVRLLSKPTYNNPTSASGLVNNKQVPDIRREGGNSARHGPTGNRVRRHLHSVSPTVNRAAGRAIHGPQTRCTLAPVVTDRPASHRPHTVDVKDAY